MRTRALIGVSAVVLVAAGTWVVVSAGRERTPRASLPTRTVSVGAIEVEVAPHHIDANGAVVKVTLDTHSVDLDMPLTAALDVGGAAWESGSWSGDGPTGHHREGSFTFTATGPKTGTIVFTLTGLAKPVSVRWTSSG